MPVLESLFNKVAPLKAFKKLLYRCLAGLTTHKHLIHIFTQFLKLKVHIKKNIYICRLYIYVFIFTTFLKITIQ